MGWAVTLIEMLVLAAGIHLLVDEDRSTEKSGAYGKELSTFVKEMILVENGGFSESSGMEPH